MSPALWLVRELTHLPWATFRSHHAFGKSLEECRSQWLKQGTGFQYLLFVMVEASHEAWPRGAACPGSQAIKGTITFYYTFTVPVTTLRSAPRPGEIGTLISPLRSCGGWGSAWGQRLICLVTWEWGGGGLRG